MIALLWFAAVPGWLWFAWRAFDTLWATDPLLAISCVVACVGTAFRMVENGLERLS